VYFKVGYGQRKKCNLLLHLSNICNYDLVTDLQHHNYNIEKLRDWYDEDNIIPLPINGQIIPKYENNFIRRVGSNPTGEIC